MPVTGDVEVLAGDDPATRIDHDRRQRALVRIDPDRVAHAILTDQHRGRTRPPPAASHRFPPGVLFWRIGRQHPGRDTHPEWRRFYQVRPNPSKARTEVDTSVQGPRKRGRDME
jgi:hypothetical protein